MGQDYFTWLNDAVMHHVYRGELMAAKELYRADELEARQGNRPTPDQNDKRYQVDRPAPTITRTGPAAAAPSNQRTPRP